VVPEQNVVVEQEHGSVEEEEEDNGFGPLTQHFTFDKTVEHTNDSLYFYTFYDGGSGRKTFEALLGRIDPMSPQDVESVFYRKGDLISQLGFGGSEDEYLLSKEDMVYALNRLTGDLTEFLQSPGTVI
ncbi:MAG: hypothetical protein AAF585_25370, partial [Verrucomicrobiota bacterium]